MHQRSRFRPSLEALEQRWVPATIRFISGNLFISNQRGDLIVTQDTTNNRFTVDDNGKNVTGYNNVKNIYITGTNAANNITVDLADLNFGGSLLINSGNGNDVISIFGAGMGGVGGRIGGNVTLLTGLGNDEVYISRNGSGDMTIGGNFTQTDTRGNDQTYFGDAGGVLRIGGNTTTTGANYVEINGDNLHVFGKNVTFSLGADTGVSPINPDFGIDVQNIDTTGGDLDGVLVTVGGNFSVTGGNRDDGVLLGLMDIYGNLNVNLRGSISDFGNDTSIADAASGTTTIFGNFNYTGGAGVDFIDFSNAILYGNAYWNLGTGADAIQLDDYLDTNLAGIDHTYIGGNLTVIADQVETQLLPDINANFPGIQAEIGGNIAFYLGNGDSNIVFGSGPNPGEGANIGGKIIIRAGNGNNSLSFTDVYLTGDLRTFTLDVIFGSGDNTVTLDNPDVTLTGLLAAGSGMNTLDQLQGTLSPNLVIINF